MKPSSLLQPTVFLMVGVPGAGKSHFARQFSEKYSVPCISADRLRMEMFNEPQYTPAEQAIVNRVADYFVEEMLRTKRSFLVDSLMGNVRSQRVSLAQRASEAGYRLLVVWVQLDQTTARSRSLKRNTDKTEDKYNPPMPETAFTGLFKQLTPPHSSEDYVVISGKHTFSAQKAAIVRKLPRTSESGSKPIPESTSTAQPQAQPAQHSSITIHTPSRTASEGRASHLQRPPEKRGIPISGD